MYRFSTHAHIQFRLGMGNGFCVIDRTKSEHPNPSSSPTESDVPSLLSDVSRATRLVPTATRSAVAA